MKPRTQMPRRTPAGRIAFCLEQAAFARLVLAGRRKGAGFWSDRRVVRECWRQNMDLARKYRTEERAA